MESWLASAAGAGVGAAGAAAGVAVAVAAAPPLLPPCLLRPPEPRVLTIPFCPVPACCCPRSASRLLPPPARLSLASVPRAELGAVEGALDDLEDASAAAIGSPHCVSAWVGNPPSRGTKSPGGGGATLRKILAGVCGPAEIDDDDVELIAAGLPPDLLSLCVGDDAPTDPERLVFF